MADDPPVKLIAAPAQGPPNYPTLSAPRTPPILPSSESRSNIVKRAMGKTADRLNRSISLGSKNQMSQSQPSLPVSSSPKRIFSLSRKGKERSTADEDGARIVSRLS